MSALIYEHNIFKCADGCGREIVLTEWDSGGPEYRQPDGFFDESCQQWYANECGDPKSRRCEGCQAYAVAIDLRQRAKEIENDLARGDYGAALVGLRKHVATEHDLGRRVRALAAKHRATSCPPNCNECRVGAA